MGMVSVKKIGVVAGLILGLFGSIGFASDPPLKTSVAADSRFTNLRNEIIGRVRKGDLPSVSIGVIQNGRILWEESIGWSDKENQIAASPDTPYGLASLGKSVTATALMVLVDKGKIDLNAPVSRYLGGAPLRVFEGTPDQVTVRRVLNMTAAIPHGWMDFVNEKEMLQYSIDDVVRNRGLVVFPPGEVYLYSNFAYAIIEKIIENVSGKSYPEFLRTEVFEPLQMRSSFIRSGKSAENITPAKRYGENSSRPADEYMLPRNSLAMYSSVDDLLRYAMFHLNVKDFKGQKLFGEEMLEQMHHLRGEAPRSLLALGFGSIDLDSKRLWLLTNGRAGGIQATLSMIASEGLAVVCLVNSTGQAADDLVFRISDIIVSGFLESAGQIISEYEAWADQPYKSTPELFGQWKGFISTKSGNVPLMLVFQSDGDIHVKIGSQLETILSDVRYREGLLSGRFLGELQMEEASGNPTRLTISIRLKENRLSGFITSDFTNEKGNFSLATYVCLTK
jgi:CubicO group peptidase (beta-lactamase class C family)